MKYPLFFLILLCLGCETIIEVDAPEYNSEPVVTSFFSSDSTWSATVHRSLGVNIKPDVTSEYISDASLMIMDGSNMVDILKYQGDGRYVSSTNKLPRIGVMYTLRADFISYASIEAVSAVPPPVIISDYSIELLPSTNLIPELNPESNYQIMITFSDTPDMNNYYRIGAYRRIRDRRIGSVESDSVYEAVSFEGLNLGWSCGYSDEEVNDPIDGISVFVLCDEYVVTDRRFDGEDYSWSGTTYGSVSNRFGRKELRLVLSSLSEDYYRYLQSLQRNLSFDPLIEEPFPVYSNVSGGLDVFAGYTNTTLVLPLPGEN